MKAVILCLCISTCVLTNAQDTYKDSVSQFIAAYIDNHEVVKGHDRSHLAFYPISKEFLVTAKYERVLNSPWFKMETSGLMRPLYRVIGRAHFTFSGKLVTLSIYQSQELLTSEQYKNYLFIPFTDETSGTTSYSGGRYLDLNAADIKDDKIILDFNKAYNPYCAYVSNVYSCPIPPKENALPVKIEAGEKAFSSSH